MRGCMPDFRTESGHYWVSSEALGYWFLRLNGFLTIPNFVVHPDTGSQQFALGKIRDFIRGSAPCFILKGSAGSGKTPLIGKLIRELDAAQFPYTLLAPMGRAARILGSKTRVEASTIHRVIHH